MQSRIRLPEGYVRFRKDLGRILRRRRRDENILQKNLAVDIGISRERLSRIERGHGWPSYETIYNLMNVLDLEWHEIAIEGSTDRIPRTFRDDWRDDRRLALGSALRASRAARGWSLRDLAARCDLSYSQLSRIERGESLSSRVLEEEPEDRKLPYEHRRLRFRDPLLGRLADEGWARID